MFKSFCVTVAVVTCILAGAQPAFADDPFAGNYVMRGQGTGPNDNPYEGTCKILAAEVGYSVSCFNPAANHTYTGTGLAQGNVLAIVTGDTLSGDHHLIYQGEYLVLYERGADGVLKGKWQSPLGNSNGSETLTPSAGK